MTLVLACGCPMRGNWLMVSNFLTVGDVCTTVSFQCASDGWRTSHWNAPVNLAWSNTKKYQYAAELRKDECRCWWWWEDRKVCACVSLCVHMLYAQISSSALFTSVYFHFWYAHCQTSTNNIHIHTYTNIHVLIGLLYYLYVILRVEAQRERTSDSSLSNEKHHPVPAPVSDC